MPYVYQAALWCDSCGEKLRATLTAAGSAPADPDDDDSYDSEDFPKYSGADLETDTPDHCAAGRRCLEGIDLHNYGLGVRPRLFGAETRSIGALLPDGLTDDGVAWLRERFAEKHRTPYQRALYRFWRAAFADCL